MLFDLPQVWKETHTRCSLRGQNEHLDGGVVMYLDKMSVHIGTSQMADLKKNIFQHRSFKNIVVREVGEKTGDHVAPVQMSS